MISKESFHKAIAKQQIEWRRHALERMFERGITKTHAREVILYGEIVEEYENDKPYPSALFFMQIDGRPLHVLAAIDVEMPKAYIITVYEPSLEKFDSDYKTRKKL